VNVQNLTGHAGCVNDLQYNPLIGVVGSLVSVSDDQSIIVWDLDNSFANAQPLTACSSINSLLVLPLGQMVAGSTEISVWDKSFSSLASVATPDSTAILSMVLMPDGVTIACGMNDSTIRLFSMRSFSFTGVTLIGHSQRVNTLDLIVLPPNNLSYLISGSDDKLVLIWDMTANIPIKRIITSSAVNSIALLRNCPHGTGLFLWT
jgi:WD40 repeat protein